MHLFGAGPAAAERMTGRGRVIDFESGEVKGEHQGRTLSMATEANRTTLFPDPRIVSKIAGSSYRLVRGEPGRVPT
jgi:hypothetical protein